MWRPDHCRAKGTRSPLKHRTDRYEADLISAFAEIGFISGAFSGAAATFEVGRACFCVWYESSLNSSGHFDAMFRRRRLTALDSRVNLLTGDLGRETRAIAFPGGGRASPSAQSFSTVNAERLFKGESGNFWLILAIILIAFIIATCGYRSASPQMAGGAQQQEPQPPVTFVAASPPPVPVQAVSIARPQAPGQGQPGQSQKLSSCPGEVRGGFCVLN